MDRLTDNHLLKQLKKPDEWEFFEDYNVKHRSSKIYRNLKTGERIAVCQGLPKVRHDGKRICGDSHNETTVGWFKSPVGYTGKPNVFSVATVGTRVYFKRLDNQKKVGWQPQIFLKGKEKHCKPNPALIDDPDNPNYHQNVIEWDYGFCKRRLRVIEGSLQERWIVSSNPHGEVRIKHNVQGELPLQFIGAYDGKDRDLKVTITTDEEMVSKEEFDKAVYPVEIGASLEVYSTTGDGMNWASDADGTVYATAHDAAAPSNVDTANIRLQQQNSLTVTPLYTVRRAWVYIDTSALGAGAIISAAVFSLYGKSAPTETDAGHPDINIVEGVQETPLANDDFGDNEPYVTLGADAYIDVSAAFSGQYNDLTLNTTGRGWISKTATTLFCIRCYGDIEELTPTGSNIPTPYSADQGAGYQPKLVITYTPGGWAGGDVSGVAIAAIAKINGVALADITKVNGVS